MLSKWHAQGASLAALVDSMPTAIVVSATDGSIVLVNAQTEALFGYRREELLGRPVESLIPLRYRTEHPRYRSRFLLEPVARPMGQGRDLFALRKDGTEVPVEIGLNPIRTEEGSFVLAAVVDLSERKRLAEEALRRTNEALERSNLELQRYAHVVSHDLQGPMRSIASFVDLLRTTYGDQLDDRARDWMDRTVQSVKFLQTLVHDLLDYSRVEMHLVSFERVSLHEVFDRAVFLLDGPIREEQARVTCTPLPEVRGDRSQLVQLMINLISNALKYRSGDPPRIEISAEPLEALWKVSVNDNGIGIAERHRERIFEVFQRLHDRKQYPGSGIGLAVCRRVVEGHGGRIWVESVAGEGSTFVFTLPK